MKNQFIGSVVLVTTFASSFVLTTCKPKNDDESELAAQRRRSTSQSNSVDRCDLKTMGEKSSKASQANFQCAYDSLVAAGKLSGGAAADLVVFIEGLKEFKETLTLSYEVTKEISAYLKGQGTGFDKSKEAAQKAGEDAKQGFEKDGKTADGKVIRSASRSALYQCFDQNITNIRTFHEIYTTISGFNDPSKIGAGQIRAMISLTTKVANNVQGVFTAVGRCSESIGGGRRLDINRALNSSWSKMLKPLATIKTIANCGVAIGEGGYIIAQNSACLVGDIKQYYDSKREVDKSIKRYSDNIDKGSGDPRHCATKLGIHLDAISSASYTTRSGLCADRCLNPATRSSYVKRFAKSYKIFAANQAEFCIEALSKNLSQNEIAECTSFCCDGKGTCVDAARRTAKGLNYPDAY